MKRNSGFPAVEMFLDPGNDFVRVTPDEKLGISVSLVSSASEPIVVEEDGKIHGLISIQNSVYYGRLPYLSKVVNDVALGSLVKKTDKIDKAIRLMINMGWKRIPVIGSKASPVIIGQISARKLLRTLAKIDTFLELMVLTSEIRKPITIPADTKVEEALELFRSKDDREIFLIDKDSQYVGTVTKDSLLKAFTTEVETRYSETLKRREYSNNMYAGEKVDRDDFPLRDYIKKKVLFSALLSGDKRSIIGKLLRSKEESIVLTDERNLPVGILSLKDLLTTVLVKDKTGNLPIKIRGFDGINDREMTDIEKEIAGLHVFLNRTEKINGIQLSNKEIKSVEEKVVLHELMLQIDFYSGKSYIAHTKEKNLMAGIKELIRDVKRQRE